MSFFKIDRKLLHDELWLWHKFSEGQAWVDIIGTANYSDRGRYYNGQYIVIKRGQLATSKLALAKRWRWDEARVRRFLNGLEKAGMITTESTNAGTIITVVNYQRDDTPDDQGKPDYGVTDEVTNDFPDFTEKTADERPSKRTSNTGASTRTNTRTGTVEKSATNENERRTATRTERRTSGQTNAHEIQGRSHGRSHGRMQDTRIKVNKEKKVYKGKDARTRVTPSPVGGTISEFYFESLLGEAEPKGITREQILSVMGHVGVEIGNRTDEAAAKKLREALQKIEGNQ